MAVDTGLRCSEFVELRRRHLAREDGEAAAALARQQEQDAASRGADQTRRANPPRQGRKSDDKLFSLSGDGVHYRLEKAREAVRLSHVRFHDLRHEAIRRAGPGGHHRRVAGAVRSQDYPGAAAVSERTVEGHRTEAAWIGRRHFPEARR